VALATVGVGIQRVVEGWVWKVDWLIFSGSWVLACHSCADVHFEGIASIDWAKG